MSTSLSRRRRRIGLHNVVARSARHAVLVWSMIHDRRMPAEIVVRWRRGCSPLQRRRLPWIVRSFWPLLHAPEQVEQEHELEANGNERGIRHKGLKWDQLLLVRNLGELGITPRLAGQSKIMH